MTSGTERGLFSDALCEVGRKKLDVGTKEEGEPLVGMVGWFMVMLTGLVSLGCEGVLEGFVLMRSMPNSKNGNDDGRTN